MSDIVDELRDRAKWLESRSFAMLNGGLERQAAEEIERLRSEVSRFERRLALPMRESPPTIWSNDSKLPE